jgi:hypothetical protein
VASTCGGVDPRDELLALARFELAGIDQVIGIARPGEAA